MNHATAKAAGFDVEKDAELERKLKIFSVLIEQQKTSQLIALFNQHMQAELSACAQACRDAGHAQAADLLITRSSAMVITADALTVSALKMNETDQDVAVRDE